MLNFILEFRVLISTGILNTFTEVNPVLLSSCR